MNRFTPEEERRLRENLDWLRESSSDPDLPLTRLQRLRRRELIRRVEALLDKQNQ